MPCSERGCLLDVGVGDYRSWTQRDDTAKHWFKFKPQRERSRKWEEPKKNSEVFEVAAQTEKLFAVRL